MRNVMALVVVVCGFFVWTAARGDFGDPLPGANVAVFQQGQVAFTDVETVADGLGPVFNENACVVCHLGPGTAVGGNTNRMETRFGAILIGSFDPLANLGGTLVQDRGIGRGDATAGLPHLAACRPPFSFVGEVVPPQATITARRRSIPLFGLGLVDTVPASTLIALAAQEGRDHPTTVGVAALVPDPDNPGGPNVVGRFGWKAQQPTLHAFSGDAYLNEMGITNPAFPNESCPQGDCTLLVCNPEPALNDDGTDVQLFTNFISLLAPPPRGSLSNDARAGEQVFTRIGCADCHAPTLTTGTSTLSPALSNQTFHPYSDFLLHDMGALGDGIEQGSATGTMMRTAPLWGLRTQTVLLHDGRASTISEAILDHEGQGIPARNAFAALAAQQQAKVLAFLQSL